MKCLLSVSLAAVAAVASFVISDVGQTPPLRRGVSVQMAVTQHATTMPEADDQDAWVVAVTADGKLYFGADPVTADNLFDVMKARPRKRNAKLYIKADARAPFGKVERVMEIGREVFFEEPVLLTAQREQVAPGKIVPPRGLPVTVKPGANAVVFVEIAAGTQAAGLRVNHRDVSEDEFRDALEESLRNQREKSVLVRAGGQVAFGKVAGAIDVARSLGTKVFLETPTI